MFLAALSVFSLMVPSRGVPFNRDEVTRGKGDVWFPDNDKRIPMHHFRAHPGINSEAAPLGSVTCRVFLEDIKASPYFIIFF